MQTDRTVAGSSTGNSNGETISGHNTLKPQFATVGGPADFSFQKPTISSYQASDIDVKFEQYFGSNISDSQLEGQRKLIQRQIEV